MSPETKINFLDGTLLDHDAGRIVLFLALAVWFIVKTLRQPPDRNSLRWSLFFFFLFAWTVMDHCPPLRRWLHLI